MGTLDNDINETIAAAVKAKTEAAVMAALAGDEVVGQFVTAALMQRVQVDRYGSRRDDPTYLEHTLKTAIQEMTKEVVGQVIASERDAIKVEVEKAIQRRTKAIAKATVDAMTKESHWRYGVNIDVAFAERSD